MKKKLVRILAMAVIASSVMSSSAFAAVNEDVALESTNQNEFEAIILEIENIKTSHPEYSDEEVLNVMNALHTENERGIFDIWNALTDSEKKLCIRYPFDALKVNTAKDIATKQTERKFGHNGLGDRSDAFRHGIWNAEMTILIGAEKAELFATAHEDKDTSGVESDGHTKLEHKNMDLHNNSVGRQIGQENAELSEDEMADYIYQVIYQENSPFIWLND